MANRKYVDRYVKELETKLIEHNLHQRLEHCAHALAADPTNEKAKAAMEAIDVEVTQYQRCAEKKCRKIYKQPLAFSLPVQHWVRRRWAYQGLLRLLHSRCSNPANVRRTARRAGIEDYKSLTIRQVTDGIAYCTSKLRDLKGKDGQLRKEHLENLASIVSTDKDQVRLKAAQRVASTESQKATWRTINRVTDPPRGGAIQRVQKEQGDKMVELVTLDEMSKGIQSETEKRFCLAESAPAFRSLLRSSVGFSADSQFALDLISGVEDIPEDVDSITRMLLTEMKSLWESTSEYISRIFEISPDDYCYYWRRARERTSSSFANIHFGHGKAAVFSESLRTFFAAKLSVVGTHGIPPSRWSSGLQVMLEKIAGIVLVNKLRAILLIEGDFNFFNKWTFGYMAMNELYRLEYIPQEQYSQRGSTAEDARMDSRPVVGSAGLVAALLRPIQTMKFFQRTAWGDSSTFMGGRGKTRPLYGLCQGNGAAPACWLMLSLVLMHCYRKQGFGASILSPISGMLLEFMGEMFADDTDVLVMRPDLRSGREVYEELQSATWNWGVNLNATGGGLKDPKCYWWLIDYECVDGVWQYLAEVDWDLVIPLLDGSCSTITQLPSNKSVKMLLGVWACPEGNDDSHLQENVMKQMATWIECTTNGHLPAPLAWKSYRWKLWPGLRYGLATLGTPLNKIEPILNRQQFEVLPLLGVNRNVRKRWRTIPHAFGGVGLFDLKIEQTIGWITMFLQHYPHKIVSIFYRFH